jgi:anaerobic selenocysteine-containing dehydrogenase
MDSNMDETWKKTACILCSLNCGLEVQTERGHITRIRGDKAHPMSEGYVCEKSQRMDAYQNGSERIDTPKRRRSDGSYEDITWEVAFAEIAAKLKAIKTQHGGESIFYYGGGNQGSHLGGFYADSTLKALGVKYRSNALAQEKTGEAWVQGKMFGSGAHGDFEHCEVAVFIGKNPWQSHGFARSRVILREIQNNPARTLIVIDPRRSETAAMADIHLAIRPGTDAWCLAAMAAILVQDGLVAQDWVRAHTTGFSEIEPTLRTLPVPEYARSCGVEEGLLRKAARRIAEAKSVSMLEDLGLQMSVHSTLSSYLGRLVWLLTGHYGRPGTNNAFIPLLSLSKASKAQSMQGQEGRSKSEDRRTPVTGAKVIMGLIPCNVIPEEILTDHPKRFRAMFIESTNPVHSLADTPRMRRALRALELSVVVDVAMTETAREADYVLPASSQFEKAEATFFGNEIARNAFQLRQPLFEPRPGTLTEAEIHARLLEAMGELRAVDYAPLHRAARLGRWPFMAAFLWAMRNPRLARCATALLYRTLGPSLPKGLEAGAGLWGVCQLYVAGDPVAAARAGFGGWKLKAGNDLFNAILANPSGVVFAVSDAEDSWRTVKLPGQRIQLHIPELLAGLRGLPAGGLTRDPAYPFVLAAGERRSETSNTPVRDLSWHRKGALGTLRMNPADALSLSVVEGDRVRVSTSRGSTEAPVNVTDTMQPGHVSLPNGLGLDVHQLDGTVQRRGVALNELTDGAMRDPIAGTPWHKHVPARIDKIESTHEEAA